MEPAVGVPPAHTDECPLSRDPATLAALAGVAELADAVALGAIAARRAGSSPVPGTDLTQHYRESGRAVHATLGGDEEPLVPEELADYLRTWCAASERSVSARTSSGVRPLERVRVPRVD